MSHERFLLEDLYPERSRGNLSHVVKSTGDTQLHLSGLVALDKNAEIVGKNDIKAQTERVLDNIGKALEKTGAEPSDVVRIRVYTLDITSYQENNCHAKVVEFFGEENLPASTGIGVTELAHPEFLIEMDALAVLE